MEFLMEADRWIFCRHFGVRFMRRIGDVTPSTGRSFASNNRCISQSRGVGDVQDVARRCFTGRWLARCVTVVPSWKGRRRSCYSLCTWFQSLIREIASYLAFCRRRDRPRVWSQSLAPATPLNDPPGFRWISRIRGMIFLLYIIISYTAPQG